MSNNPASEPQQEIEVYQYNVNIIAVTMKIKFPCKMHIDFNENSITTEVSPGSSSPNKFIFNQEVTLKEDPNKQHFELVVHLTTDKGAKYVGGVVRLLHSELMKSEGERLNIPLSKCLDSEAGCEMRVDQVSTSRVIAKVKPKHKAMGSEFNPDFHVRSPKGKYTDMGAGIAGMAKSEYNFPLHNNTAGKTREWDRKSREMHQLSYIPRRKSPSKIYHAMNDGQGSFQGTTSNALQAQVYKEGYEKLKQKYKKEAELAKTELNKRITLENNENSFKLEIMRYKLKCEEQEKSLHQKSSKITVLQNQLVQLQKKEMDLNFMREEGVNKDHQIKILEDTVRTLQKDNNELKLLNSNRFTSDQEKISHLKDELYQAKLRFEAKEAEFSRELKARQETILKKEQEIAAKSELIERERYSVEELERSSQNKIFEFEKVLQNQRSVLNQKIADEKEKRGRVEQERSKAEERIKELNSELQKAKLYSNKIEYDKKILQQSNDSMKQQLEEVRSYKQKYTEVCRQVKFLNEDKAHLEKQLEKTISSKEINLNELNKQHASQIEYLKRINKELEERSKQAAARIIELESQLEMAKNQLEKAKRTIASSEKELGELRGKEKELRQAGKSKDEQILALQNEIAESGNTYKSGEQGLRFELEKAKEELTKTKNELQSEVLKNNQLEQNGTQLNSQLSKLKMKLQFTEEKSEKEAGNHMDRIANLETQLKDTESQLSNLTANYANLKQGEKELQQKVREYELGNIGSNETLEKLRKEIKILEERNSNYESQVKSKNQEIVSISTAKGESDKKVQQKENEIGEMKAEINKLNSEKNKNEKIIEMLNKDLEKAKQDIGERNKSIGDKQTKEEQIRTQLKQAKQQYTKLEMKNTTLKKQYEKFKENLVENINSSFSQLPQATEVGSSNSIGSAGNRRNNGATVQNRLNNSNLLNRSTENSDIVSMIVSNAKDAKVSLNKLIEQNKQLMRENERLSQDMNSSNRKALNNEQSLSQQIQQLEEELATVYSAKEEETIRNDDQVFGLNSKLREKEAGIRDLTLQIEELEFTLSNVKLDLEATQEEYAKKESSLKKEIIELKEQIEYQSSEINNLQDHIERLEEDLFLTSNDLEVERDVVSKKEFRINELTEQKEKLEADLEDTKRAKKQLLERISELELMLNSEKDLKQKHLTLLEEEEAKNSELKTFINNLMKQKEVAIKSELEKSESIINLESSIIELERDGEILKEENAKLKKGLEELKEQTKRGGKNNKELELQLAEERASLSRVSEKLREREKEVQVRADQLSKLEEKHRRLAQKNSKEITELQQEMDQKYTAHLIAEKENNERVLSLEREINKLEGVIEKNKSELTQYEEFVFAGRQKNEELTEGNRQYEEEISSLKEKVEQLDQSNNDMAEEVREKEETLFQLSGKIYNLEMKLEAKEADKNERLDDMQSEWGIKYEGMCDEYEQRLQLIEKEKLYLQERLQEKEAEHKKLLSDQKLNDSDVQNMKRAFEEKIKALEEDRLSILGQKNNQIQRITEENKDNYEKLKEKETDYRKLSHELDIARATITKLDLKSNEAEDKIKSLKKVYDSEVEQLKKKEQSHKTFKEGVVNNIWKAERDVRKTVQYFVKNLLTVTDQKHSKAVVELTKSLEANIVNSMAIKIDEKVRED